MLRSGAWYIVAAGICLAAGAASSADAPLLTKAPAQNCIQAVDGINGELAGFGGTFGGQQYDGGTGSLSVPLGCEFGAQVDGAAAGFDGRFLGTVAGHLFWRNPAKGLLGAYGDFTQWNEFGGVRAAHLGPEAEWYNGRLTVAGVAGVEFGNSQSGTVGTVI